METVLKLDGVTKRYPGVLALDGVSIECVAGEVHAILGENGSGKSTLLGIASGSVVPTAGSVRIAGKTLAVPDPLLARTLGLATVYQDDSLVRELTVAENLLLGTGDAAVPYRDGRSRAAAALAAYDLAISPDALVGSLTPAQRQFLEIIKALQINPRVLLLDEPTATLDLTGVEKLSGIIRRLTAAGAAVVYVTHRLPEILAMADRVSILRDGRLQGTYPVGPDLSEGQLITLMIGRAAESEYPPKLPAPAIAPEPVLTVRNLSGAAFRDVTLSLRPGEILGFAGAEGNGQREALRAIAGFAAAQGSITCKGRTITPQLPQQAVAAGLLMLSADRAMESIFPALGVRENITVQVLDRFAHWGLVSGRREREAAGTLADQLRIVASSIDQPVDGLSGGNQQKGVLARSFLFGANAILVDEPTQGVDANARFDIYRAMRERAAAGTGFIVNSSDAMELAGICDRVLVFSRGEVIAELRGAEVTEETIVSSFLRAANTREQEAGTPARAPLRLAGLGAWARPLLLLLALIVAVGAYAATRSDVFLGPLNLRHLLLATAPLALVTMAQLNALLVGGFDVSVGSTMSLTVVLSSFLVASGMAPALLVLGVLGCLAVGGLVGLLNGIAVRKVGINPVIATIATLSILQGIALYLRPTPAGSVNADVIALLQTRIGFVPLSIILIIASAIAADWWLMRSRGGLQLRAAGFRERAARRNGVPVDRVQIRGYFLSGLIAAAAGLLLASEVGVGHPTVGSSQTLLSIAAAVVGGASLAGGRGSFVGAVLGALFFTLSINIIPLLGLSAAAGTLATGVLTLVAVLLYSGARPLLDLWRRVQPKLPLPARA